MKAHVLEAPAGIESNPLMLCDVPCPEPGPGEVLVRVNACGLCRTDLHVTEGELPTKKHPVVPGHQVVGVIDRLVPNAALHPVGTRVGIPWLHRTCGVCEYCRTGRE